MREIKFRAWDTAGKPEMYDIVGFTIPNEHNITLFMSGVTSTTIMKTDCILMQYTGLKDSEGVEIYEGDIVTEKIEGEEVFAVIEYNYCYYHGRIIKNIQKFKLRNYHFLRSFDKFKVIGNKYNNPELLEEDEEK